MRVLKWLLFGGIGVLILFIVGGFLLPTAIEVEESIVIRAAPSLVHRAVTDFEVWQQWDPWGQSDDTMVVTFGEQRRGVGASYSWSGETTGTGTVEIVEEAPDAVRYRYTFNEDEEQPAYADMFLEPLEDDATALTWSFRTEVGFNPLDRYLILLVRPMIETSFAEGLQSLKELLEEEETSVEPAEGEADSEAEAVRFDPS